MKRVLQFILTLLLALMAVYFCGPRVDAPDFSPRKIELPDNLASLDSVVNASEKLTKGLKPDNEARIVWADSAKKQKTGIAFLYLHGFSASPMVAYPINVDIAKKYHANAYLFRNANHGIDLGDSTMANAKADDYINAAEKALAITQKLGDSVIIIGTSLGGALALYLAAGHPEVKAIALNSPGIRAAQSGSGLLIGPWGFQIAKLVFGTQHIRVNNSDPAFQKYYSTHYHLNGLVATANFVLHAMNKQTFARVKCPVFLGYWYKNEKEQDDQASVAAMLKMFDELGTPPNKKKAVDFPEAGNHTIDPPIFSKDYMHLEQEIENFIDSMVVKQ